MMNFPFEKNNGVGKFPKIPNGYEQETDIFQSTPVLSKPDFVPDFVPDFSERFDVENDSVCLALNTLGMSRPEYNSVSAEELKSQRKINCSSAEIWALNILIYYKKNSKISLPNLSPSPSKNILTNNLVSGTNSYKHLSPSPKIYPSDFDC